MLLSQLILNKTMGTCWGVKMTMSCKNEKLVSVMIIAFLCFSAIENTFSAMQTANAAGDLSTGSDWPMFGYDPSNNRYTSSNGSLTNRTLWAYTTGNDVRSSPAVVGGVVYVGSYDNNVYALNATTGTRIWSYTTGYCVFSSPAVVGGVVYVGSLDNKTYALNATTGTRIWSYTTGYWVTSSPAVVGGVVYVGSYDNNVYALNATTGTRIWSYTTESDILSSPAVVGGVVYVGSYDNNVYALNATTGIKIWSYTTADRVGSPPTINNGALYVGSYDNNVYALNATTGTRIWSYTTGNDVRSSPAVVGGVVYVGSLDNKTYALNATTGTRIWSYTTGSYLDSSPAVASGVVYVGSYDNNVYALNATTGTRIWSYTTGNYIFSSPAVANNVVYIGSNDKKIYAIAEPSSSPVQCSLSIISAHGVSSPSIGTRAYASGSSVMCSVTSPVTEGGVFWTCVGWTGTGSVPVSGSGLNATFTITQNSSITWNWVATSADSFESDNSFSQFSNMSVTNVLQSQSRSINPASDNDYIRFFANPGSYTFYTSGSILFDSYGYLYDSTQKELVSNDNGGGNGQFLINYSITISGYYFLRVTASTTGTYTLYFRYAPSSTVQCGLSVVSAHGSPSPAVGSHTYNSGSSVTCSVVSPVIESGDLWRCTGWKGTGSVASSGSGTSMTFVVALNSSITWNWVVQPILKVVSAHGSPSPAVSQPHNSGSSVTCSVVSPVTENGTVWTCTGWVGTGSVPSSGTGTSTTFVITETSSITWNWVSPQQSLIVISDRDKPDRGNPIPAVGSSLFDSGSTVTCSVVGLVVEGNLLWNCTGWSGTGSVPSSGTGNSTTFVITEDSSITWLWKGSYIQCSLVVASAHGTSYPGVGVYSFDSGSSHTFSVASPVIEDGVNWTCVGWSGSGSVPVSGSGTTVTFDIYEDSSITWEWVNSTFRCRLSFGSNCSNYGVFGDRFYDYGAVVTESVPGVITDGNVNYTCVAWSANSGVIIGLGAESHVSFKITSDTRITWFWVASKQMPSLFVVLGVALVLAAVGVGLAIKLKLPALRALEKRLDDKGKRRKPGSATRR